MKARIWFLVAFVALMFARPTLVAGEKHWNPVTAVGDARRDVADHRIRFCFIGGYVPHPVGVPDNSYHVIARYPHIEVGNQGCVLTEHSAAENEYAKLYNQEMWRYLSQARH